MYCQGWAATANAKGLVYYALMPTTCKAGPGVGGGCVPQAGYYVAVPTTTTEICPGRTPRHPSTTWVTR